MDDRFYSFTTARTLHAEVCFASFLSGGFTAMAVINPPERKLAERTSVRRGDLDKSLSGVHFYFNDCK